MAVNLCETELAGPVGHFRCEGSQTGTGTKSGNIYASCRRGFQYGGTTVGLEVPAVDTEADLIRRNP